MASGVGFSFGGGAKPATGFGAATGGGFGGGFGAASTGAGFGASTGGGFGAFGASSAAAGGFGAATGGGFGAATGGAFGAAAPGLPNPFGQKPATAAGFGGFGAATGGGFGATASTGFGTGGAFGASTGGAFGAFGAAGSSAGFGGGGAFGMGSTGMGGFGAGTMGGAMGGFGQPGQAMQQPGQQQNLAKQWLSSNGQPVTWRTQYKDLPDILKRKMNQHHAHVEECKQHSKTIRDLFQRRQGAFARPVSFGAGSGAAGAEGGALVDRSGDVQRNAARLRHWLASLKTSLKHDRSHLDSLQQDLDRQARQMQGLRAQQGHVQHLFVSGNSLSQSGSQQYYADMALEMEAAIREMEAVMVDLNTVLEGSIARPASYPPELIEQVFWQTESFWNAMSAKVAALHAQAERSRDAYLGLERARDAGARDPFAQSETIKVILQVSVTGIKFNPERFREALAHKVTVNRQRLRILQVDPMDNAVLLCIEDGDQPGFPSSQVANTLRRLFTQGDVQLAMEPVSAFSLQVGHDEPIIHPAASPHIDDAVGLDAHLIPQTAPATTSATQPAGAFGTLGATQAGLAIASPFGATTSTTGATGAGFGTGGAFGATTGSAFGAPAATGGGFGSFGASTAAAGTGAATGMTSGGFATGLGGAGATGGLTIQTGAGFGGTPNPFGAGAFGGVTTPSNRNKKATSRGR